jgi:uncharacterized protein YndB with AHSA1/START domain
MQTVPVVKEVMLNAPAYIVWKAITDKDQMKEWYFAVPEFKPEPGFQFKYYGEKNGQKFPISGKIQAVQPERKLVHTWSYDDYPAETIVTFELFPEGDKTRLRLTHTGLENISSEHTDVSPKNHQEGWNMIIGTSLPQYIEKQDIKQ